MCTYLAVELGNIKKIIKQAKAVHIQANTFVCVKSFTKITIATTGKGFLIGVDLQSIVVYLNQA